MSAHAVPAAVTYTLTLPIIGKPADILLTSNQRIHRRVRDERVAYWRDRTQLEATNALKHGELIRVQRAHIFGWLVWPNLIRRDPGNWYPTVKACVDGLVRAGVLEADDFWHLDGPDMRRWPEKGPDAIRLEIRELEGTA